MTISIIGHGYVGLVTACIFADFGNKVYVIGHTREKIRRLSQGDPLFYEPGLKELLKKNLEAGRIFFTTSYSPGISQSEIVFIAVGTPPTKTGEADLTTVFHVTENIGKHLKQPFTVVSCKSTVPVGTNKKVEALLNKFTSPTTKVAVASCPEFLREGTGIYDSLNPDRIIVGTNSKPAAEVMLALHQPLPGKRIVTDLASAELIKYTANAMLATKISFANLISFYCEKTGADVETVLDGVGLDQRIGRIFFNPGVGYGGSCFPKDVKALTKTGLALGIDTALLESVENINHQAGANFFNKITLHTKGKSL
ncbi:UDP-glucose/GDP-mannose dehydrogenase family protein, partial [Candidatus Roizmanbacteria bacterium]|nr:UDP-glucose/GDP-mannose dehydrogenase family protein [Candidatus Roizmanbacteria bacterium]